MDPIKAKWEGPDYVITALYKWAKYYDPEKQNYSLRFKDWRYIRYENEKEELYHTAKDNHEWKNLANEPKFKGEIEEFREKLLSIIPKSIPEKKLSDEEWKDQYFAKNQKADADKDGKLSWPELNAHKKLINKPKDAEYWKNIYFKKNPAADSNKDAELSWKEFHTHKKSTSSQK